MVAENGNHRKTRGLFGDRKCLTHQSLQSRLFVQWVAEWLNHQGAKERHETEIVLRGLRANVV